MINRYLSSRRKFFHFLPLQLFTELTTQFPQIHKAHTSEWITIRWFNQQPLDVIDMNFLKLIDHCIVINLVHLTGWACHNHNPRKLSNYWSNTIIFHYIIYQSNSIQHSVMHIAQRKLGRAWCKALEICLSQYQNLWQQPKSHQFWRWSGYTSIPNFTSFLPCVFQKISRNMKFRQFH